MTGGAEDEENQKALRAEDFVCLDKKQSIAFFDLRQSKGKKLRLEVKVKNKIKEQVAMRVASLCFLHLQKGNTLEATLKFRDELVERYVGGEDVPEKSPAWEQCKAQMTHRNPVVGFQYDDKRSFQTTVG